MRKLHFPFNEIWEYKIGESHVQIKSPTDKLYIVECPAIKRTTWEIFERGREKKTSDGSITPGEVKAYIGRNLRKDDNLSRRSKNPLLIERKEEAY